MATRRTSDEPGFVLHRYDWSESSLILEVFSRHHGRLALVAKAFFLGPLAWIILLALVMRRDAARAAR